MSQEGYDKLVAELQHMVNVELPQVKDAIAEARDKGDLSENFEYHAAKREQGRLLGRIRFKQRVLEHARVIDKSLLASDCVVLLSRVSETIRYASSDLTTPLLVKNVTGPCSLSSMPPTMEAEFPRMCLISLPKADVTFFVLKSIMMLGIIPALSALFSIS